MTLTRREALALIAAGAALPLRAGEPEVLAARVAAGDLPPMAARLPEDPRVVNMAALGRAPGRAGGSLRMLIGGQRDVRFMPINGYSRLVGYAPDLTLLPDILAGVEVEEERVFTLRLRRGHRWSDGHPFTAEDFRYVWEDVILHPDLGGMEQGLKADGQPPIFAVLDDQTVRYTWPRPLPGFLPALAAPVPLRIMLPAHYMKGFHIRYTPEAELVKLAKANRVDDWTALHQKMGRVSRPENPDLPTLEPWRPRTAPPAQQFIFERNPFFHRVDENGVQLPYVDRMVLNVTSYEILPAKVATGDSDFQPGGVEFSDYTLLKDAETRFPIAVRLWRQSRGSRVALYPNLTSSDPVWRALLRDVRVRRALSLAVNREEINKALFYGLARESANTVLPESPLFRPEYATAWARHDPDEANALLDAAGLSPWEAGTIRRLPDGRPAGILVESAGESTVETDVLALIRDQFLAIGIAIWTRVSQRELFRSRALAGITVMSVFNGLDNGLPTADMPPADLAPTGDDQLMWPAWGVYTLSGGKQGLAPDLPEAQELAALFHRWRLSVSAAEREEIWHRMLTIHADQVFSIGTVNGAPQPVVRAARLRNMPDEALIGFQPTSGMGIYMPDTFWLED